MRNILMIGLAGLAGLTMVPAAANAQSYGYGYGYRGGYDHHDGYRRDRHWQHERWERERARIRWEREQRRRWHHHHRDYDRW